MCNQPIVDLPVFLLTTARVLINRDFGVRPQTDSSGIGLPFASISVGILQPGVILPCRMAFAATVPHLFCTSCRKSVSVLALFEAYEIRGVWLCEHHVDQWSLRRFFPRGRGVNFPGERLTDEEGEWAVAFIQRMSSENPGSAVFMIQVMAASMCIQMARAAQKNNCPAWLKRSFRIGGFVLSPVMALWPAATLSVCLLVCCWRGPPWTEERLAVRRSCL